MRPKRFLIVAMILLLSLAFCAPAISEALTKAQMYETGLSFLCTLEPEDVEIAIIYFENVGNYEQAKRFVMYGQALLEIFAAEEDDNNLSVAAMRLESLDNPAFDEVLSENLLPSVAELQTYIRARRHELDGALDAAVKEYTEVEGTLDALERRINLSIDQKEITYQEAVGLYEAGEYAEAARLFKALKGWKDSAELYETCLSMHEHTWIEPTCETPWVCSVCGKTEGTPLGHTWKDATCTEAKTCTRCGETDGPPLGHSWTEPTCTKPKTCMRCGLTEGIQTEHSWTEATCTQPRTCVKCGLTEGTALGHDWQEATYTDPKTCRRCGTTTGKPLSQPPKVGGIVRFGHYEQDGDTTNGPEEIEWIVLEVSKESHTALVISKYGLDVQPYHKKKNVAVTWETSSLRKWLNRDFLNTAFSDEEQGFIRVTLVANDKTQGYKGYKSSGGNDTKDKIFLLSYAEANRYFGVKHYSASKARKNTKGRTSPTAYAKKNGAMTDSDTLTDEFTAAGSWWLRSPGDGRSRASRVEQYGSLRNLDVNASDILVRPAFWIDLSADFY